MWWESVIPVVLAMFILFGFVVICIIARQKWRKIAEEHAQWVEDYPGQHNRNGPFRPQRLSDGSTPHQGEYYNHIPLEQVVDNPPAYDAAVQGSVGQVLPRKLPQEAASFNSDISIIESPPSYFAVQENLQNTRS